MSSPTVTPFEAATAVVSTDGDGFRWEVPDGWQQGRGAWGGLVVAAIVRAAQATEPDSQRTVRSVTVQIMSPAVVGVHRLDVVPVRVGSAMSTWDVTVSSTDGGAVAQGVVICGSPRAADGYDHSSWGSVTAPTAPSVVDVPRVPGGPPFPEFTRHLDIHPMEGLPFAGGPATSSSWFGFDAAPPWDAAALLALVDASWPASLPLLDRMPRVATVNFTANLLVDPATVPAGIPLLSQSFVSAASDGFTSEHRRLWTADGRLAVDNLQTIVVGA